MRITRCFLSLPVALVLVFPRASAAGTLDDAPFRIVVPSSEWRIDDSTPQPLGKDVFLAATISNTNALLKSVVTKTTLKNTSASSLDELCAGIRDSFANPAVKKVSEADTTFLGRRAKTFVYQITQGEQPTYNETTVFVADGKGWTIACVGRPDQKNEIKKIIGYYQKKTG